MPTTKLKKWEKFIVDRGVMEVNNQKSAIKMDYSVELGLLPPGGLANEVLAKVTDEDYVADWVDVNTLISNIVNPISIDNVLFVSMNGNDNTAMPGSLDKKYATIREALNDATTGQLIYVFPGQYQTNVTNANDYMWKDEVSVYLSAGANFQINFTGITSSNIFNNTSLLQGALISASIYGDGTLTLLNTSGVTEVEMLLPTTFKIDVNLIQLVNTYFYMNVSNRLNSSQSYDIRIKANKLTTSAGVIWIEQRVGNSNNILDIRIGEVNHYVNSLLATMIFKLDNTGNLNANFNIDKIQYVKNNTINGLFAFHNNFNTTNITLNTSVYNRSHDNAAIITTNQEGCYKNINLNVDCYCQIWHNTNTLNYATATFQEKGYVKISGLVDLTSLNNLSKSNISLIDFDCHASKLHFDLDLTINTTKLSTIFNCTGNEGQYIVTGNIDYLEQSSITGDRSVFEFGSYNSLISTKQPLFKDLLIIMRTLGTAPNYISAFAKNSLLGNNELRLLNCSSSHGLALANGGITQLFASPQGQLFIDTNIQ